MGPSLQYLDQRPHPLHSDALYNICLGRFFKCVGKVKQNQLKKSIPRCDELEASTDTRIQE